MIKDYSCVICHSDKWPVCDFTTGFQFCDSCWHDIKEEFKKIEKTSPNWLRAIAHVMEFKPKQ